MNKQEKKTLEFYDLAVELKKWFEERDLQLGYTDTYYGQLAILIQNKLSQIRQKVIEENNLKLKQKIGLLRQWLNEDRITDISKMVTSDDLETWLK